MSEHCYCSWLTIATLHGAQIRDLLGLIVKLQKLDIRYELIPDALCPSHRVPNDISDPAIGRDWIAHGLLAPALRKL